MIKVNLLLNTMLLLREAFPKKLIMGFTFIVKFKKHTVCCLPQAEMEIVPKLKPRFPSISLAKE